MDVFLLESKIHRAAVTGGEVNYEGSLTISSNLMDKRERRLKSVAGGARKVRRYRGKENRILGLRSSL